MAGIQIFIQEERILGDSKKSQGCHWTFAESQVVSQVVVVVLATKIK